MAPYWKFIRPSRNISIFRSPFCYCFMFVVEKYTNLHYEYMSWMSYTNSIQLLEPIQKKRKLTSKFKTEPNWIKCEPWQPHHLQKYHKHQYTHIGSTTFRRHFYEYGLVFVRSKNEKSVSVHSFYLLSCFYRIWFLVYTSKPVRPRCPYKETNITWNYFAYI